MQMRDNINLCANTEVREIIIFYKPRAKNNIIHRNLLAANSDLVMSRNRFLFSCIRRVGFPLLSTSESNMSFVRDLIQEDSENLVILQLNLIFLSW